MVIFCHISYGSTHLYDLIIRGVIAATLDGYLEEDIFDIY